MAEYLIEICNLRNAISNVSDGSGFNITLIDVDTNIFSRKRNNPGFMLTFQNQSNIFSKRTPRSILSNVFLTDEYQYINSASYRTIEDYRFALNGYITKFIADAIIKYMPALLTLINSIQSDVSIRSVAYLPCFLIDLCFTNSTHYFSFVDLMCYYEKPNQLSKCEFFFKCFKTCSPSLTLDVHPRILLSYGNQSQNSFMNSEYLFPRKVHFIYHNDIKNSLIHLSSVIESNHNTYFHNEQNLDYIHYFSLDTHDGIDYWAKVGFIHSLSNMQKLQNYDIISLKRISESICTARELPFNQSICQLPPLIAIPRHTASIETVDEFINDYTRFFILWEKKFDHDEIDEYVKTRYPYNSGVSMNRYFFEQYYGPLDIMVRDQYQNRFCVKPSLLSGNPEYSHDMQNIIDGAQAISGTIIINQEVQQPWPTKFKLPAIAERLIATELNLFSDLKMVPVSQYSQIFDVSTLLTNCSSYMCTDNTIADTYIDELCTYVKYEYESRAAYYSYRQRFVEPSNFILNLPNNKNASYSNKSLLLQGYFKYLADQTNSKELIIEFVMSYFASVSDSLFDLVTEFLLPHDLGLVVAMVRSYIDATNLNSSSAKLFLFAIQGYASYISFNLYSLATKAPTENLVTKRYIISLNQAIRFKILGATNEPLVSILRRAGLSASGEGTQAISPHINKDVLKTHYNRTTVLISDIDTSSYAERPGLAYNAAASINKLLTIINNNPCDAFYVKLQHNENISYQYLDDVADPEHMAVTNVSGHYIVKSVFSADGRETFAVRDGHTNHVINRVHMSNLSSDLFTSVHYECFQKIENPQYISSYVQFDLSAERYERKLFPPTSYTYLTDEFNSILLLAKYSKECAITKISNTTFQVNGLLTYNSVNDPIIYNQNVDSSRLRKLNLEVSSQTPQSYEKKSSSKPFFEYILFAGFQQAIRTNVGHCMQQDENKKSKIINIVIDVGARYDVNPLSRSIRTNDVYVGQRDDYDGKKPYINDYYSIELEPFATLPESNSSSALHNPDLTFFRLPPADIDEEPLNSTDADEIDRISTIINDHLTPVVILAMTNTVEKYALKSKKLPKGKKPYFFVVTIVMKHSFYHIFDIKNKTHITPLQLTDDIGLVFDNYAWYLAFNYDTTCPDFKYINSSNMFQFESNGTKELVSPMYKFDDSTSFADPSSYFFLSGCVDVALNLAIDDGVIPNSTNHIDAINRSHTTAIINSN